MWQDKAVKPPMLGKGWRGTLTPRVGLLGAGARGVGRAGRARGVRYGEGNAQLTRLIAAASAGYSPVSAYSDM